MKETTTYADTTFAEAFGYRIYFPVIKNSRLNELSNTLLSNTIEGSASLTEIFTKICGLGCMLIYKPRSKSLIIYPKSNSNLEAKICS